MREPMSISDQVNAFNKSSHQHLVINRTVRQRLPVYSSLNTVHGGGDEDDEELKTLSFDVYTTKHLTATGKSIIPYTERTRLDKLLLPSINKDISHDENRRRRRRKRPSYRKSLFHSYSSNSTQADLAQLTARGTRPEPQVITPTINDDDTVVSFQRHHAPPPSPSDDAIERLLYELQERNQSRPPSRQSPVEKEGFIPFRLPLLSRSSTHSPPKDIRSTLSNYLQKYY